MQQLIVGNPAILKLTLVLLLMTKQNRRLTSTSENEIEGLSVHQLMFGATSQTNRVDKGTFVVPTAIELLILMTYNVKFLVRFYIIITYKYGELEQLISELMRKVMV